MKTVRVATGYSNVPLPDGRTHNAGPVIHLTDAQWESVPEVVRRQLVVLGSQPDPASYPPTTPGESYTYELFGDSLSILGAPIFLVWDGADYQPSKLKPNTDRPKTFIGPTDPHGFNGVVLNQRDQWINA